MNLYLPQLFDKDIYISYFSRQCHVAGSTWLAARGRARVDEWSLTPIITDVSISQVDLQLYSYLLKRKALYTPFPSLSLLKMLLTRREYPGNYYLVP